MLIKSKQNSSEADNSANAPSHHDQNALSVETEPMTGIGSEVGIGVGAGVDAEVDAEDNASEASKESSVSSIITRGFGKSNLRAVARELKV